MLMMGALFIITILLTAIVSVESKAISSVYFPKLPSIKLEKREVYWRRFPDALTSSCKVRFLDYFELLTSPDY